MAPKGTDGPQPPPQPPTGPTAGPAAPPPKRTGLSSAWWLAIGLLVAAVVFFLTVDTTPTILRSEFYDLLDAGQVKKVTFVGKQRVEGEVRDPQAESAKALKLTAGKFVTNLPPTSR